MRSLVIAVLIAIVQAQSGDVMQVYSSAECVGTPLMKICKPGSCCPLGTSSKGTIRYVMMSSTTQYHCKLTGYVDIGIHNDSLCSFNPIETVVASENPTCQTVADFHVKFIQHNKEYSKFLCGLQESSIESYIQIYSWMRSQCVSTTTDRISVPLNGFERTGQPVTSASCPQPVIVNLGECGVLYHGDNACAPEYIRTDWSCDSENYLHIGNRPFSDSECLIPKTFLGTALQIPTTHLPVNGQCVAGMEGLTSYRAFAASNYTMFRMCDIINTDTVLRDTLKFMPFDMFAVRYPLLLSNGAGLLTPLMWVLALVTVAFM